MINTKESGLEKRIESDLINLGGYTKFDGTGYNRNLALVSATLLEYVQKTQPNTWEKYQKIYNI